MCDPREQEYTDCEKCGADEESATYISAEYGLCKQCFQEAVCDKPLLLLDVLKFIEEHNGQKAYIDYVKECLEVVKEYLTGNVF